MRTLEHIRDALRRLAVGRGLATPWETWRPPAILLLSLWGGQAVTALLPHVLKPLGNQILSLLSMAFFVTAGLTASRFFFAGARREARLRELLAQGEETPVAPLLAVLEAEMVSRPSVLRPHLGGLLEKARERIARHAADVPRDTPTYLGPAVRDWLFTPAPPGPFPAYAGALVDLAERDLGPACLPLLRDLRDPGAHIAATPDEAAVRRRAETLVERLVGPGDAGGAPLTRPLLERLLGRVSRGHELARARAEQDLRAHGPEVAGAASGIRCGRRWWWGLPGAVFVLGAAAIWYLWTRRLAPGGAVPVPASLLRLAWLRWVTPDRLVYAEMGLAVLVASWLLALPAGWSKRRVWRAKTRLAAGLSLVEGREAVAALLDTVAAMGRDCPAEGTFTRARARAARRLADLPSGQAAELLVPHGGWFFRQPSAQIPQHEWAPAVLAAIRHTWDPAARPLLRSWANNPASPVRAEAGAALAELEERIARQGTLVRPAAPASDDTLLRPAGSADADTAALVRPAEEPEQQALGSGA